MTFVPPEMHMDAMQREQVIGRMVRQAVDNTPQEKRRAYMFQPQSVLTMQTFMENILETEGITREMIARQRQQSDLLRKLANADRDVRDFLVEENKKLIDETFLAMLQSILETASQMPNNDEQLLKLTNLRAKLMVETPAGREMERRQTAVQRFSKEAQKQGGLSAELLLKHVLLHREDESLVDAIVMAGQGALRYNFFSLMADEISKEEKAGNMAEAKRLSDLRARLLKVYDEIQKQTRQVMAQAAETLNEILAAPDTETAVLNNLERIDDAFMYYLASQIATSDEQGEVAKTQVLQHIHDIIVGMAEQQTPPEVHLLNALLEAPTDEERTQILAENADLVSPDLLDMLNMVQDQVKGMGDENLNGRLNLVRELISSRLSV